MALAIAAWPNIDNFSVRFHFPGDKNFKSFYLKIKKKSEEKKVIELR